MKTIHKIALLLALVCTLLVCGIMSASAATDGYYTYEITYKGAKITDVDSSIGGDITVPDALGGYDVTEIGYGAFDRCDGIASVVLPDTLKVIGAYAFDQCWSLKSINFPEGLTDIGDYAFHKCYALESAVIPDSVTYLGESAFSNCTSMKFVTLGSGIKVIKDCTFDACRSLSEFNTGDNLVTLGSALAVTDCLKKVIIGKNVKEVSLWAFDDCEALEEIIVSEENDNYIAIDGVLYTTNQDADEAVRYPHTLVKLPSKNASATGTYYIPDSLYEIGDDALSNIEDLDIAENNNPYYWISSDTLYRTVEGSTQSRMVKYFGDAKTYTVSSSVKIIGASCFESSGIEKLIVSYGVEEIWGDAFLNCEKLKEVVLPDSIIGMGGYVFSNCTSLEKINWPARLNYIPAGTFALSTGLKEFIIPSTVRRIETCAFGWSGLENIVIPKTVTYVGVGAFSGIITLKEVTINASFDILEEETFGWCRNLETVTINGDIETISASAFEECNALKTVNINSDVNQIEEYAFAYCWVLEEIELPESITKICEGTFRGDGMLRKIYIPGGVTEVEKDAFMNAGSLAYVYFGGTEAQWDAITIGVNNEALSNATIYFTDGMRCRHKATEYKTQIDSTCTNTGVAAGVYCTDCNTWTEGGGEIGMLTHTYTAVVTEPTCENSGYTKYTCTCGDSYIADEVPAVDHDYVDGVCSFCGKSKADDCTCNCHKTGFTGIIWKILRIFYRIFKINPVCACGAAHY